MQRVQPELLLEWRYIITQIHGQLLFFNRYISSTYYESFIDNSSLDEVVPESIISLSKLMTETIEMNLNTVLGDRTNKNMQWIYSNLAKKIEQYSVDTIHIGVHSIISYLKAYIMTERLDELFHYRYHIKIEPALEERSYDLLVSDSPASTECFTFDFLYILSDSETKLDIHELKKLLDNIYRKKKNL